MKECSHLLLGAVTAELEPLARRLGMIPARVGATDPPTYEGTLGGRAVFAAATGMGSARAAVTARAMIERCRPERVVIVGLAGALRDGLAVGDAVHARRVIDAVTGDVFTPAEPDGEGVVIVSAERVVTRSDQKRALGQRFEAGAVDMEAAAVARVCEAAGVTWSCIKVISDDVATDLPAYAGELVDERGRPLVGLAIRRALGRVQTVPSLIRLGRNSRRAARALAETVAEAVGYRT